MGLKSSIKWSILILLVILPFIVGWLMEEPYSKSSFQNGETHFLGFKFMPPCNPFEGDITCGFDVLMIIYFVLLVVWSLFIKGEKKCQ